MTIWEYAVARALRQILNTSEARVLNEREIVTLGVLSEAVEHYEAVETAKGVKVK